MFFQSILLLMVFHEVCPYYLYNPYSHDILALSSLDNVPTGYKLIPPPYERRSSKRDDQNHIGQCSDPGFFCIKPYDSLQTYQFHCSKDSQCPHSYKCCRHRCFIHRICVKATIHGQDTNRNPHDSNFQRRGTCERWPYSCRTPYHHSLTNMFKCENDKQCPKAFKCCQQSCFEHKICSRAITHKHENVEEMRRKTTKDLKITTGTEIDENGFIHITTTEITTAAGPDVEATEVERNEVERTEVETTEDDLAEIDTTVEVTEAETTYYDTIGNEITGYVEELKSPTTSDAPGVESTETTIENTPETIYADRVTSTEFETTAEISASESASQSNDLDYSPEITTGIEYVNFNSTERDNNATGHLSFKHSTPDPNAIIPEYSLFYSDYDYQNDTEYDTDSTYS